MTIHKTSVTGIDLTNRQVQLEEMAPLTYDYLVLALGATVNFFGVKGAEQFAFPLYTLPDAIRLKNHILQKWEATDKDPALVDDGALNVVVVGGGPTGVESAGAIIELYRGNFVKDYPNLPAKDARVILVEFAPALLGMFKKDIQTYTKDTLQKRGVEVRLGDGVVEITPDRVTLKSGEVLKAHTLVWGAGLQANPLVHTLGVDLEKGSRVPVGPDLSLAGHPEVFVSGDAAWITDTKTNQVLPQLGSVALQSGEHAGENIARRLQGKETEPFRYFDKGTMATIGRGAAVLQMPGGHTMKGKMASLAWGTVHLALLTGGDSRAKTMVDWGWAAVTRKRTNRISVSASDT
jgi:NADH dehydrogenase